MKEQIIEYNIMLCLFTGGRFDTEGYYAPDRYIQRPAISGFHERPSFEAFKDLEYNRDWNWLMSVIDKIETLGYVVTITKSCCTIQTISQDNPNWYADAKDNLGTDKTKIEVVYECVVKFITFWNSIN